MSSIERSFNAEARGESVVDATCVGSNEAGPEQNMSSFQPMAQATAIVPPRLSQGDAPTRSADAAGPSLSSGLGRSLFIILVIASLVFGWSARNDGHLTAESGLGYALGIIGGTMMLLLLGYPLRKRVRLLRNWGALAHWFRIHMMFGVLGPVLILFHSNFGLGSINSNITLFSMLTVAVSGLVGRYLYRKVHHGLYGNRITLNELRQVAESGGEKLAGLLEFSPLLLARLHAVEATVRSTPPGLWRMPVHVIAVGVQTRWIHLVTRRLLRRELRDLAQHLEWSGAVRRKYSKRVRRHISDYLATVRRVAAFTFFERLLSLWHVLHLPLFFGLLVASLVHVLAVHMY